jgi:hypothetical protein
MNDIGTPDAIKDRRRKKEFQVQSVLFYEFKILPHPFIGNMDMRVDHQLLAADSAFAATFVSALLSVFVSGFS